MFSVAPTNGLHVDPAGAVDLPAAGVHGVHRPLVPLSVLHPVQDEDRGLLHVWPACVVLCLSRVSQNDQKVVRSCFSFNFIYLYIYIYFFFLLFFYFLFLFFYYYYSYYYYYYFYFIMVFLLLLLFFFFIIIFFF